MVNLIYVIDKNNTDKNGFSPIKANVTINYQKRRVTVEDFVSKNAAGKKSFNIWLSIIKRANWNDPLDIIDTFNSADILGNGTNRVVFNVGGNKYRVICTYYFGEKEVHLFIKWIGTHAEYTKVCNQNEQYTVENY